MSRRSYRHDLDAAMYGCGSKWLGFLSDAHGNDLAFNRGLDVLRAHGADQLIFLGDAVGYRGYGAVLDCIASLGDQIVCTQGNHDARILAEDGGDLPDDAYRLKEIRASLTKDQLALIASWPTRISISTGRQRIEAMHGGPLDPVNQYLYPDSELSTLELQADVLFVGNTHRPFVRFHGRKSVVNVGSCGMPRDDGRYGSVALYDVEQGMTRILRFDISDTYKTYDFEDAPHPSVLALIQRRDEKMNGEIFRV